MWKFVKLIKKIVSVICVLAIFIVGLNYSNQLLIQKNSLKKFQPFFDSEEEFDVLFFGSSHVHMGISMLDLFHDYGITGYNLAVEGNFISSNYYIMKDILELLIREDRKLPKVVVIDIFDDEQQMTHLHSAWDYFSFTRNKKMMIDTVTPKKERAAMEVPFLLYHNRWNELTEDDFRPYILSGTYGTSNGGYGVSYPDNEIITNPADISEIDMETVGYIEQIRKMCKSLDIQLVLIHIPYSYKSNLQRKANGICRYAEEHGIIYENYMNKDIGIDYDIDFFDAGHLNRAGMRIVTDELGRMLAGMGLEDHREGTQTDQWRRQVNAYMKFRISKLAEIKDARTYLMALNDSELISTIQIFEGVLGDVQISKLIERLRAEGHQIIVTEERAEIKSEDGQSKRYDVYCEVYRRSESEVPVHKIGFTL